MAESASKPQCAGCGRFISYEDCARSKYEFTPLNEFGPEEVDWTCPRCLEVAARNG